MINCAHHDFIEIACLYHYSVQITCKDATIVQGRAETTLTSAHTEEFLVLRTQQGEQRINLDLIASMRAITRNPHFKTIDFL